MGDTGLGDRVVLVTGANGGIGAATAKAFAAEGARVFVTSFGPPIADEVVQAIRSAGGKAEGWEADLADPATVPALFDHAEAALGPVDVLVNNACWWLADTFVPLPPDARDWRERPLRTITAESHDRHFAVNSRALALMMSEFTGRHVARGATWGRIINLSTDGALGFRGEVSYGASKNALESYSRAAAAELGRYGITVNIVSPGPTQTGALTPQQVDRIVPSIPLGRIGQPEDVADVIVLLASEQARWLTGQTLFVGGGHEMR